MIEIRKILCPSDFSEFSRRALDTAVAVARLNEGTVTVLHVTPLNMPPLSGLASATADTLEPDVREKLRADLLERLRTFSASAAAERPVEVLVEEGNIAGQIVTLARAQGMDLIVMGTHGHGGFERLALGSTTDKTLRKASCPVLTVPPAPDTAPASGQFRRIVCATDFSESASRALECAVGLARKAEGRVTLLHVLEGVPGPRGAAAAAAFDVSSYRRDLEEEARVRMAEAIPPEAGEWIDAQVVGAGKPYEEILKAAEEAGADLIAMGVHGRTALTEALFGSTAYQVARHATCPVLTARVVGD
jgi:nucleotide-binding universal stress UspA family protein